MPLLTIDELQKNVRVFRTKAGGAIARFLMKLLNINRLNNLYDRNSHHIGPAFANEILKDIGVTYTVINPEILDNLPEGPFITVSNHPYGSIDGIILVDMFGHLRKDYKVMVNKILGRIESLEENFICVTPTGEERTKPTAESLNGVRESIKHIRQGGPLGLFPAGAVSDFTFRNGCVQDRDWQDPVIHLIKKMRVPIVPVHFLDRNSNFYYGLGLIDWKVRLLRLPSEVFNKRGKRVRVALGNIITPQEQDEFNDMTGFKDFLRTTLYKTY